MATDDPFLPPGLPGDGAYAPPSGWLALLSINEQAAYDAYLKGEARLAACIHDAAARLRAYWRARERACENGGGPCDPRLAAQRSTAQAELEGLYEQLRLVRCLRRAVEQEALARLNARRRD